MTITLLAAFELLRIVTNTTPATVQWGWQTWPADSVSVVVTGSAQDIATCRAAVGQPVWTVWDGTKVVITNAAPVTVIDRATHPHYSETYSNEVDFIAVMGQVIAAGVPNFSWQNNASSNARALRVYAETLDSGPLKDKLQACGTTLTFLYVKLIEAYQAENWPWWAWSGERVITQ